MRLRSSPRFAFLAAVAAALALCVLGSWQVYRLHWKEALTERLASLEAAPPLPGLPDTELLPGLGFYRVTLEGSYLAAPEFHVAGRYLHGKQGYQVLSPFRLADGRLILLNRGWVPAARKEPDSRPGSGPPEGRRRLVAMLRADDEKPLVSLDADVARNLWFRRDAAGMGRAAGLEFLPVTADALGEATEALPVPSDGRIVLRNDHLGYAVTWFSLAAAVMLMFVFRRRLAGRHEQALG